MTMRRWVVVVGWTAVVLVGCQTTTVEERAREQAELAMEAMGAAEARAAAQPVTPERVRRAQEALTAVHEYMGPINGELDSITINAIQAFQRTHGLRDDGILDATTEKLLAAQLTKK